MYMSTHNLIQMLGLDPSLMDNTTGNGDEEGGDEDDAKEARLH